MSLPIEWQGHELVLLSEGAICWPAQSTLLVADLHLGKDATFRGSGIPVPAGSDDETLGRLDSLISKMNPRRLIILGDLFHGTGSKTETFRRWSLGRSDLRIDLVVGNHDRWVKLVDLGAECCTSIEMAGIVLSHAPIESDLPVICGHIHPGFLLTGRGRRTEKLKCFWQQESCLVMPAFGAFTGNFWVSPSPSDQIFLIAGKSVVPLP